MDAFLIKMAASITPIQFVNTAAPASTSTPGSPSGTSVTDKEDEQMKAEADAAKQVQDQQMQQTDQNHQMDLALKSMELKKKEAELNSQTSSSTDMGSMKHLQTSVRRSKNMAAGLVKKLFTQQFKSASFMEDFANKVTGADTHAAAMAKPMSKQELGSLTVPTWDANKNKVTHVAAPSDTTYDPYQWADRSQMPGRFASAIQGVTQNWNPFGAEETHAQMAARMAAESAPIQGHEPGSASGLVASTSRGLSNLLGSLGRGAKSFGNSFAQQVSGMVSAPVSMVAQGVGNVMESNQIADEFMARNPGKTRYEAPHQGGLVSGPARGALGALQGYLTARMPLKMAVPFTGAMAANDAFRKPATTRLGLPATFENAGISGSPTPAFVPSTQVNSAVDSAQSVTALLQDLFSRYGSAGMLPTSKPWYNDIPGVAYLAGAR